MEEIVLRSAPVTVELGQLRLFAKAIGEENPIYFDPEAAKKAGFRTAIAPPTFSYGLAIGAFGPDAWRRLGVEAKHLLHGEQCFEYFAPIFAGDRLQMVRRISDRYQKKDGRITFIVTDTEVFNQEGELCVRSRMTGVIKAHD